MGCCANCCRSFFLTLMTLVSLGVLAVVLIVLTILISTNEIKEVSQTIYIIFIIATVIVCLVFIFAIYASCCGGKVAKTILGIIFLVLTILLLAFGIACLALKDSIDEYIVKMFTIGTKEYNDSGKGKDALARVFKCVYPGQPQPIDFESKGLCQEIVQDKFQQYDFACGILLIIFAVLMLIAAIVCFVYACKNGKVGN